MKQEVKSILNGYRLYLMTHISLYELNESPKVVEIE